MNPNQAQTLQKERAEIKARLESGVYTFNPYEGMLTPQQIRSKDAERLKEINQQLNNFYNGKE